LRIWKQKKYLKIPEFFLNYYGHMLIIYIMRNIFRIEDEPMTPAKTVPHGHEEGYCP